MRHWNLVYRVQLNKQFTFRDLIETLPYLKKLGVSHVYLSPILQATEGSTHCYDVTDYTSVNNELGGEDDLRLLSDKIREQGMGMIIDIVPNHMAYNPQNCHFILLTKGDFSGFASLFDVYSDPFSPRDSMIFPFLPQPLDMVVKSGLVSIRFGREPGIKIGDTFLEVDSSILRSVLDKIDGINATSWDNGNGGTKSINLNDPDIVRSLFRRIHLIPTSWHYSGKRINYRRFFAVNGLISIRSEDIETLIRTHRKIIDLAMSLSTIEGLRIDHIDGLFDPARYVRMMRENLPGRVLMAEKILMPGEILDSSLGLDGTTGYDFLSALDLLFLYPPGLEKLREVFNEINRGYESQGYVLERYKIEFLEKEYSGDLDHLAWLFYDSLVADHGMELTFHETRETVKRVLMSLNRYRTYASYDRIEPLLEWLDNFNMEQGCTITRIISTHLHNECLVCLKPMLKLQQYTGAIMAKNLEDRLFFSYNPLIFLNEVGHAPWEKPFTPEAFFDFVEKRKLCRYSFNETSTHDTKYGEDLRYVGIAISQFPVQYEEALDEIQRSITVKESAKKIRGEHLVYLIQLIIASYGVRNYYPDYTSAVKGQLIKAARESALETDWKNVNEKYERLVLETFDKIISEIDSKRLMKTDLLIDLCRSAGEYDSISSLILKFILPGISACYQGSEFGNYHFTDPDNRALVDFAAIHANLREFSGMRKFRDYPAGFRGYKLALFSFLASLRSKHLNLIQEGKIASLSVSGDHRDAVIAYTVSLNHEVLVIALVRYTSAFFGTGLVFRAEKMGNTVIDLGDTKGDLINEMTGQTIHLEGNITCSELFAENHFAILYGRG